MPRRSLLSVLLALAGASSAAHGAELGEAVVKSWLGQPMIADVELLPDGTAPVQVSLARPTVYESAGLAVPSVLGSVHLSVMRRDGHQFLHVTTIAPVEQPTVHLFLDLNDSGRHTVREVTLWFVPDPHPAPPPPPPEIAPLPPPAPKKRAAAPDAAAAAEARRACAALDYKNAELSAQIVDLEEKVKQLQSSVDMPAPHVAKPSKPRVVTKPAPEEPAKPRFPSWLPAVGIGAAALAGLGAAWWSLRRRLARLKGAPGGGLLARWRKKKEDAPSTEQQEENPAD
ncbi:MAG TPA: hypothetical protein VFF16_08565 [Telluria sp.]|nr:hypothetical protein [Telluria sp.]